MNTEYARRNMVTQQLRTNDIIDENLLTLIQSTPREDFVPSQYEAFAFADMMIPLGKDKSEIMLPPLLEAQILKATQIKKSDKVLEIGTGSAYLTCLIGKLSQHVTSCDINAELIEQANTKLTTHGVHHVQLCTHNAYLGWEEKGPFDVIIYTGSVPYLPNTIKNQLKPGGRLFAIVGQSPAMQACLFTRDAGNDTLKKQVLLETDVPTLTIANAKRDFIF